jgi:hypothetical protein
VTNAAIAHQCAKFVSLSKDEQDCIQRELTNFSHKGLNGVNGLPDRTQCPRMFALVKESLRVLVPAPFFREKLTCPGGYPDHGIPGGTHIG